MPRRDYTQVFDNDVTRTHCTCIYYVVYICVCVTNNLQRPRQELEPMYKAAGFAEEHAGEVRSTSVVDECTNVYLCGRRVCQCLLSTQTARCTEAELPHAMS